MKIHVLRLLNPALIRYRKEITGDKRSFLIRKLLLKNGPALDPFTRILRKHAVVETDFSSPKFCDREDTPRLLQRMPDEVVWEFLPRDESCFLVLTDNFYPGWQARGNDQELEIVRANWWMQGVIIPAGVSRIVLTYFPQGVMEGFWISVFALLIWLLGFSKFRRAQVFSIAE